MGASLIKRFEFGGAYSYLLTGGFPFLKIYITSFEVDIFVGLRAQNRSREPIAVVSKNSSARYPLKKCIPFYHVIWRLFFRVTPVR
jgi:hypothetical protein